jgi:hypothetical protein
MYKRYLTQFFINHLLSEGFRHHNFPIQVQFQKHSVTNFIGFLLHYNCVSGVVYLLFTCSNISCMGITRSLHSLACQNMFYFIHINLYLAERVEMIKKGLKYLSLFTLLGKYSEVKRTNRHHDITQPFECKIGSFTVH